MPRLRLIESAPIVAVVVFPFWAMACNRSAAHSRDPIPAVATAPTPPSSQTPVTPKIAPSAEARALSDAFASAAQAIRPSVVRLDVEGAREGQTGAGDRGLGPDDLPDFLRHFFEAPQGSSPAPHETVRGTGSGVIIDGAGNILTNSHVVRGTSKVTIKLADDRSFPGKVIGTDPMTDVGVVRFEKVPSGLVAARLGNSDTLRTGDWAIAVGSPLGMEQTVTAGIISGVGETGSHFRFLSGERVRKYIQNDAKINPGNSGGPLVNLEAEVIGINTLINVGPGGSYGFAIPINQAAEVENQLIKEGRVRYPYIGASIVSVADAPEELKTKVGETLPKDGAIVAAVTPGGPAAQAGIQPGDVITELAGRHVKTAVTNGSVTRYVTVTPTG
jgi:serine protease Do